MLGQSVGIYPVSNSTPEPIIAELNRIIDSGQGVSVKISSSWSQSADRTPFSSLPASRNYSKGWPTWITRLDKSGGAGTDVKVYRMRYGDARQVAALLNDMFVGTTSSGLDSPANQLSPGGGMVASSSAQSGRRALNRRSPSQTPSASGCTTNVDVATVQL